MSRPLPAHVKRWAIAGTGHNGRTYLYDGTFTTRRRAISDHEEQTGRPWKDLKRRGDFAIRVVILPWVGQ